MAYFERADESSKMILCNICNVKCAERGLMIHRGKCIDRHPEKFSQGILKKCEYDSGHIVEADKMDLHLEFCQKRQTEMVREFQQTQQESSQSVPIRVKETWDTLADPIDRPSDSDEWNRAASDDRKFALDFKKLSIKGNRS